MHCAELPNLLAHVQVHFLFCISMRRLPEKLTAVLDLSNLLVLHATSFLSSLLASSHNKIRGLAPSDQSICHIYSTWLLVTFNSAKAQPVKKVLKTPYHTIVSATFYPCHNGKDSSVY